MPQNQDANAVSTPVDSLALGIWGEEANQCFIATKVIQPNPSLELKKGRIFIEEATRDVINDKPTDPLEKAPKISGSETYVDYETKSYRIGYIVNPKNFASHLKEDVGRLREQQKGVAYVTRNRRVLFESLVSSIIFNTSNFTNTTPSTAWSDLSSSNPKSDLNTQAGIIKKNRSIKPNCVIWGQNAYAYYVSNEKINKSIASVQDQVVRDEMILRLLKTGDLQDLKYSYVADASYNNANPGQSESREFIWNPNMVWIGYIQDNFMTKDTMKGALALKMEFYQDSMGQSSPVAIREIIPEHAKKGTSEIEGEIEFDLVVLDTKYGRLLTIGS